MDVFFVFLLLFTEIILLGIAWIVFKGDVISPSIVTLALFILSTACFAYKTSEWIVVFNLKGYLLFTLSFIVMIIVEKWVSKHKITARYGFNKNYSKVKDKTFEKKILSIQEPFEAILFIIFILFTVYYIYRVYTSGMALGATNLFSSIGYNKEEGNYDGLARLLYNLLRMSSYVYMIIFCNNVLGCNESIKRNLKSAVIVFMTLICTFFSGQRSACICYIVSLVVAAMICLYDKKKYVKSIEVKKFVKKLFIVAIIIIVVFYASSNIVKATNVQRKFIDYITYYFGSTTALMGRIVENPEICHTPFAGYFGEKTFNGFWRDLYTWGIVEMEPTDRRWIKMGGPILTRAGNEYTFLCAPYIDFGFVGTIIFIAIFYYAYSYIYYWKIRRTECSIKKCSICAIYIFLYTMVVMSFYQDTIRSYTRFINIAYVAYIIIFNKLFVKIRVKSENRESEEKRYINTKVKKQI